MLYLNIDNIRMDFFEFGSELGIIQENHEKMKYLEVNNSGSISSTVNTISKEDYNLINSVQEKQSKFSTWPKQIPEEIPPFNANPTILRKQ